MSNQNAVKIEDVDKAVELAIAQLDRLYGKGTVMKLDADPQPWPAFSTGAPSLDVALGIGGLPRGRVCEIYGPESSGKSSICLSLVANVQRQGGKCLYIDAEHAVDPVYAKALGVSIEDMLFAQPSYGEEGIQILETMVRTGGIDVAVVDSVAALIPKAELDGDVEASHMGLQSRLMAKAMRKMVPAASETNTLVIFTNQIREKIGVMFGNPETQPGGRSLKFAASVRVDLRKREDIKAKDDGRVIGSRVKAKVIKNKMAPPLRIAEFEILYGKGVYQEKAILEMAVEREIAVKKGAWISYNDENVGQGFDNAAEFLKENRELYESIKKEVWSHAGLL